MALVLAAVTRERKHLRRCEVFTAMKISGFVFWVVMQCGLEGR
jgi:hypothetical protein